MDNTTSLAVYGYERTVADTKVAYHEAGLIQKRSDFSTTLPVRLQQIQFAESGEGVGNLSATPLSKQCVPKVLVKRDPVTGETRIRARIRHPLEFRGEKPQDEPSRLSEWIDACDCKNETEEIEGNCFGQRFAATVQNAYRSQTGKDDEELTRDSLERVLRAVGQPFMPFERLLREDRGLTLPNGDHDQAYLIQSLNPGDTLCFHSSAYAPSLLPILNKIASISEPAAPACFAWQTVMPSTHNIGRSADGTVSIGIDPFGRIGPRWKKEEGELLIGEAEINKVAWRDRFMTTVDQISGRPDKPYRNAMLFTWNSYFLIANGPERNVEVKLLDVSSGSPPKPFRSSFLVLTRDSRLQDYMRRRISDRKGKCGSDLNSYLNKEKNRTFRDSVHTYLKCLTKEWARTEGVTYEEDVGQLMLDIAMPSNVRPFVQFEIAVNGQPHRVRAGSTVLNAIDERLSLTAQVFDLRTVIKSTEDAETASALEAELVAAAAKQIRYERRTGVSTQMVDLSTAARLEDLQIPLASGDRLTWH